jgi:hypothetical protein
MAYPIDREQLLQELVNLARINPFDETELFDVDLNDGLTEATTYIGQDNSNEQIWQFHSISTPGAEVINLMDKPPGIINPRLLPVATGLPTDSTSLTATNTVITPNEIVQDFNQGGIGDCWYLSSIKSLSISTLGQQLFGNVINVDADSASVTFQGTPSYTYEISLANLATEVNDGDDYSRDGHSNGNGAKKLCEQYTHEFWFPLHWRIHGLCPFPDNWQGL